MRAPAPLPRELGEQFSVGTAVDAGVSRGRLRRSDLDAPFHGVRARQTTLPDVDVDPFTRQLAERRIQAHRYAPRLRADQFFSHESAVAIWGGPLPLVRASRDTADGDRTDRAAPPVPIDGRMLDVHVSTLGLGPLVRAAGVTAHRAKPSAVGLRLVRGFTVASPATTWAQMGGLSLIDLVALGDYFCRVWRDGPGRPNAGTPAHTDVERLRETLSSNRWHGIRKLRQAVDLIREDSWSARESQVRCQLVIAGLPEPTLNHDVYDEYGRFIACVDLAYPDRKIAIEYHGVLHSSQYAADVERVAALRAAGWTVIEVTSALYATPDRLIERVRRALRG